MREKNFENKIVKYLESVGVYRFGTPAQKRKAPTVGNYFKVWGGGFQQAGIPDLICNINGYYVALELKGTGGRPSKLQELNIDDIKRAGGIGMIVYPDEYDDVVEVVEGLI